MEELIKTFHIDLKLMIAQMFNFAIVLLVLYKFAYKPLLKTLNDRSRKIEKGLIDAQEAGKKLEQIGQEEMEVLGKAKKEAQNIIAASEISARKNKDEIAVQAKAEAENIIAKAKEEIENEKKKMLDDVRMEVAGLVMMAAEKILKEKMTNEKDREMIKEAIKK